MWILVCVLGLIVVVIAARALTQHRAGSLIATGLITGVFDNSPLGRQLWIWFEENPIRSEQRQRFLNFAAAMNLPPATAAEKVMRAIHVTWRPGGPAFGAALAGEVDELVVFYPPKDVVQTAAQERARAQLATFKDELHALDSRPAV
jgi:hypothetical protein